MKFIFCLAYWNFFEKCYLVVWCDVVWCGGMVRPPRLVSYAFLYTTGIGIRTRHIWPSIHGHEHTFVLITVLTALHKCLRAMCNFRTNADYRIEHFSYKNIFSNENIKRKVLTESTVRCSNIKV